MNAFKKIIRWTPIVTIGIILLMLVGMYCYVDYDGYGQLDYDLTWAMGNHFGWVSEIKGMFGHAGWKHWLANASTFIFFATPMELLLKKKWKMIISMLGIISAWYFTQRFMGIGCGVGSSGWIMVMPGALFASVAHEANGLNDEWSEKWGAMFLPTLGFGLSLLMANEDLKSLHNADGVGHDAHLIGAGIGIVIVLIAVAAYLPRWVIASIKDYKRELAWRKERRGWAM